MKITLRSVAECSPLLAVLLALMALTAGGAAAGPPVPPGQPFPGTKSAWHSYDRFDFTLADRACCVVVPKHTAPRRPWIWRARFFGHEPQTDLALLAGGFHVAYIDVAGLYGCPQAVALWDRFYDYLTTEHQFDPKPALEGMSRGGLIVLNWAAANPSKVACIYADAPVCDIRSWPGGKGKGNGSPRDWEACLGVYGLTEEQATDFRGNPIDHLQPLAAAGVPLLHVCGDHDLSVPFEENTKVLADRYRKLGGSIRVIVKRGIGHHPHSLKDPTPIVDFVLEHTGQR